MKVLSTTILRSRVARAIASNPITLERSFQKGTIQKLSNNVQNTYMNYSTKDWNLLNRFENTKNAMKFLYLRGNSSSHARFYRPFGRPLSNEQRTNVIGSLIELSNKISKQNKDKVNIHDEVFLISNLMQLGK